MPRAPHSYAPVAALVAALHATGWVHASPSADPPPVRPVRDPAADPLIIVGDPPGLDTAPGSNTTTGTPPETTSDTARLSHVEAPPPYREAQQFAVPVPRPFHRSRDKKLRQDRGMVAAGVIFTAICGAGVGLGIWAVASGRGRTYGQNSANNVAALTGLFTCTVGAIALAATGATRLKKRRAR